MTLKSKYFDQKWYFVTKIVLPNVRIKCYSVGETLALNFKIV